MEEIDVETYEEEPSSLFEEISATEQPLSSDGEETVSKSCPVEVSPESNILVFIDEDGNEIKLTEEEQQNLRDQGLLDESRTYVESSTIEEPPLAPQLVPTKLEYSPERELRTTSIKEASKDMSTNTEENIKNKSPRAVLKETSRHQETYKPVGIYGSPNTT